ncbi:MAG: hypothetical protein MZU95_10770 [Desulfomicrobium escambiense]|nr:hypothetical protein [Desulfomicrobium escambiense]
MDHRFFSILAHPSGRLINEREPYEVDLAAVIRKAKERGCFLELNANPQRLDLTDIGCQMAKEAGVLVAINTDAHSVGRVRPAALRHRPGAPGVAGEEGRAERAAARASC